MRRSYCVLFSLAVSPCSLYLLYLYSIFSPRRISQPVISVPMPPCERLALRGRRREEQTPETADLLLAENSFSTFLGGPLVCFAEKNKHYFLIIFFLVVFGDTASFGSNQMPDHLMPYHE